MTRPSLKWGLGLIGVGVAIMALPASLEGPVLVRVSPGHALATLDAVGLVFLLLGSVVVYWLLWAQRRRLIRYVSYQPVVSLGGAFVSGAGLGLLVASSFSGFFWWWAIGGVLFGSTLVAASIAVVRPTGK